MRWLCEAADEGGGGGVDHFHTYCLADLGFAARENCGFILARAAYHLLLAALCHALHEYVEDFADIGFVRGKRQLSLQGYHTVKALYFHIFADVVGHSACGECTGAFRVFEHKGGVEAYFAHKFEGLLEILFAFAVKTCEQVGAYAAVGNAAAYCGYAVEVPFARVLAVHGFEHRVAAALYREVYMAADVWVRRYGVDYGVDMSFGCDVVNRTLISGAAVATADSSAAKSVVVPSSATKR